MFSDGWFETSNNGCQIFQLWFELVFGTNGYKIRTVFAIIIPGQTGRCYAVFILVFVHFFLVAFSVRDGNNRMSILILDFHFIFGGQLIALFLPTDCAFLGLLKCTKIQTINW